MALFGVADSFGTQVKKLLNPSEVRIGNLVFDLHQQWSFVIIIIGLIFSSSNYVCYRFCPSFALFFLLVNVVGPVVLSVA